MSAAARTLPTPKSPLDVAPGEELPVELLESWLMASARSQRGFAGTVEILSVGWPPDRLEAA